MSDPLDLTSSQTVLSGAMGSSAFDHGRYAPGAVLADRYRIIGLLGRGGMGEVYRADDLTLGQSVALKFLPESVAKDRANLERLLSEVRTARQVSHPNVCRVHDVGEAGGRRFISMEYIDGEDLSVLLRRIGRLPADKCVEIARQLCAGLAASHERGVLHRDLKPANIMLDGRGRVRITDFGLATALQADGKAVGEFAGTPAYMAPEQLEGKPVSVQTDIYALGLVLYEIFTGKRFHNVGSIAELRQRHADATSADLSTSEALMDPAVARVVERCLESEPRRRPASCALVAASLPGGDPLAAAIAAGETPSPQLVAAASVQGALKPRTALVLGVICAVTFAAVSWGHWNPPKQFGVTRSVEVMAAQTRDLLATLGYPDPPVDTAGGFAYRYSNWRDSTILQSPRPWSTLRELRPASVYFWYREQPTNMALIPMGRLGLEGLAVSVRGVEGIRPNDPPMEPGSVYVERAPDGSLDTLIVRPAPAAAAPGSSPSPVDWSRLFNEARLDMGTFLPVPPEAALSAPGDKRLAWAREAAGAVGPLRVEAAEMGGRPVAFRVLAPRTPFDPSVAQVTTPDTSSGSMTMVVVMPIAFLALSYIGAAFFMRRNFILGRGDRRGAAKLAKVTGLCVFAASWLAAPPPFDSRVFGAMHGAAAIGLFAGAWCWAYYMAIEPFVRRQWPRMLVGWSRLMAGEWRDPQVGRELFLGGMSAAVTTGLIQLVQNPLLLKWGGEPPLYEEFYFRGLSGSAQLTGGLLQTLPWAVFAGLMWIVLLLLLRRLMRNDVVAVIALSVVSLGLAPASHWLPNVVSALVNVLALMLALRVGFLVLIANVTLGSIMGALPFSPDTPGFVGTLSWLTIAAVIIPTFFGLYTSLAGQSIFGNTADEA